MSDTPTNEPSTQQPHVVSVERKPEVDKRPVSVRAKETADTGYRAVRWIVLLVLVVIAAVFIIRNFNDVPVNWVFRTSTMPLSLVMIIFLLLGLAIGWLTHWFTSRPSRRR